MAARYPGLSLVAVLFAASLHFIMGPGGISSFGHAAYFGLGAYGAGLLVRHAGLPMEAALLLGPLVAAAGAALFGWFSVRLSGVYLAMLTLAFAQIVWSVVFQWDELTGGSNGLVGIWPAAWLADKSTYFLLTAVLVVAGIAALWRIVHSPFGRVLVAIRDNPARARALGYPVHRYKLVAFVLSAALAGLAGGLFAMSHQFVTLDTLHWTTSGQAVVMVVLGGIGTLWGAPVAAAILVRLQDVLSLAHFEEVGLLTGGVFVVVVLLFRRGIWGTVAALLRRWRAG